MEDRFNVDDKDVHRFVNKMVEIETKRLNKKDEAVKAHEQEVNDLQSLVEHLKQDLISKLEEDLQVKQQIIKGLEDANKAKEEEIKVQMAELKKTIMDGNALGEKTRYNRMVEQWELCDINPGHPKCQKKDKSRAKP